MSQLALNLLGPPRVEIDGREIRVSRRKALALLAYLAVTGQSHTRDALATLLWPEQDQSRARNSLRGALVSLRKALGEGWLEADRENVGLSQHAEPAQGAAPSTGSGCSPGSGQGLWLDVAEFQKLLAACLAHGHPPDQVCPACIPLLAGAAELYRGDFMAGFTLPDSPAFDEWQYFQSEGLRDELAGALERLAQGHAAQGEFEPAIAHTRRWVAQDPLNEPAQRLLMQLYAWSGQRAAAIEQYALTCGVLAEELGAPPDEETTQLYQAIVDKREPPPPAECLVTAPKHNLPAQLTPFVGRDVLLAEIADRLRDPTCRLLSLVGPGGSGKTRLALEAAAAQLDNYPHGVFFVSLAPLDSSEAIVPTVAKALGFTFYAEAGGDGADRSQDQLLRYLSEKQMLLLMDNYEHLLDGAKVVTNVLQAAPGVKILATSRARLNLGGEHLLPVPGMDVPDAETLEELALSARRILDALQSSAVKLFVQSARRAQPAFELAPENVADVVQICHLVAGMPLGILLAAGWLEMLTSKEIVAQLGGEIGSSLDFLETDLRDVPARQRSMRSVFDHSWRLLNEREQEVFRKLSIFRGGFTAHAGEQVARATLPDLRGLVHKSLLGRDSTGRYEIHELLRQYAAEKLREVAEERESAKDRHCAFFAAFLQQREEQILGEERKQALEEIATEIDNVRAAWSWTVAQGKVEEMDRSLESLAEFYRARGWSQEGEEAFARAAQKLAEVQQQIGDQTSKMVLGKVVLQQGRFCDFLGLVEKATERLQESLTIFRDLGARREMAYALCYLGGSDSLYGGLEGEPCQEGLAIFKEISDQKGIALALRGLAWVALNKGEYATAEQQFQETLAIFREFGDQDGITKSLSGLGYTTWILGEYQKAKQLHQEMLALCRETGDQGGIARSLGDLAIDVAGMGEYGEAKQLFQKSLAIYREIGNPWGIADELGDLGETANVTGEWVEAAQFAQESLAVYRKITEERGAWSLRVLGNAMCKLGNLAEAGECLRQALEQYTPIRLLFGTLHTLVGVVALLAAQGEKERALELLALVLHHPISWQWTKDRAAPLVAQLEAELPPDAVAAARERGRARDLETTVAELLVELGGTGPDPLDQPAGIL